MEMPEATEHGVAGSWNGAGCSQTLPEHLSFPLKTRSLRSPNSVHFYRAGEEGRRE